MCKVYNTVGCLATIESHLHEHKFEEYRSFNINEYESLYKLIDFQKSYSILRQQIISDHKLLVEQEKSSLSDEITQLNHSINSKKSALEQQLQSDIGKLKHQLDNLPLIHSTFIQAAINHVKKIIFKLRIEFNKLTITFKIAYSLKHLKRNYNKKNDRYQYIVSHFEDALAKSSLLS